MLRVCSLALLSCLAALAQAPPTGPVVSPRGVINAFAQQPAPATVSPGGLLWITGLNLGPPDGLKGETGPWPTKLGDYEVLLNGRPIPIGSISPGRMVAQVPWEAQLGAAQIVVRRGEASSRPARFSVGPAPALRSAGGQGFGEAAALASGGFAASGLGATEPSVTTGAPGPADPPAVPRDARVYIGGLAANAAVSLSRERVGEFDINVEAPALATAGDLVTVVTRNRPANRLAWKRLSSPEVLFLPVPEGAGEIRALTTPDLSGAYVIATAARDEKGCYAAWLFDFMRRNTRALEDCFTIGNRNAATPFLATNESSALAALAGPPEGEPPEPVSSKVRVFAPDREDALAVDLPAAAVGLANGPAGNVYANLGGTPPALLAIDVGTGEITDVEPGAGGGGLGPAGAGAGAILLNLQIDLGDGLTHVLSPPRQVAPNTLAVVVGDDADTPQKAKLAMVNLRGEVAASRDFPEGWMPLLAPAPPQRPGQPGRQPGPGQAAARFRVLSFVDQASRTLFVPGRNRDSSADSLVAFAAEDSSALPLPEGWFFASCSPNLPFFNLELSRRLAFFAGRAAETEARNPCPAQGFLVLDLESKRLQAVALPGQGQANAAANFGDVSDFIYAANSDPSRRNTADTLYVLDGVTATSFRFDLPPEISSFAGVQPFPAMGILVATATAAGQGVAGFVIFDLERVETRVLPTPEGFATMQLLGIFPATRKLIARGVKPENAGTQYLIYDLLTGDLMMPPNPEGVVFAGPVQQQAGGGQPGQPGAGPPAILQRINPKANTITAVGFDGERKPAGVMVIRVP
ncbi:MAG: hypothetical protein HYS04_13170 [Acidobacteria bacterium]|nr:hypothetical protein [Acidobacteriota bacterium]